MNSDKAALAATCSDSEFTSDTVPFVSNAALMELAKLGLFPIAAAISASVSSCAGAPLNSVFKRASTYEAVAFNASPADSADALLFNAASVDCNEANEAAIALDADATVDARADVSATRAVLTAAFDKLNPANANDAALSMDATPL